MCNPDSPVVHAKQDAADAKQGVALQELISSHSTSLHCGDVDCHVIGVCHLSHVSVEEARQAILALRPSVVCVELCPERESILAPDPEWPATATLPILSFSSFQEHWPTFLDPLFWAVHLQLMALEALLGIKLGCEQVAAAEAAEEVGAMLFLADRQQSITVGRTIAALADLPAICDLVRGLRGSAEAIPGLVRDLAELELLMLKAPDLEVGDFERAVVLARGMIDTLLNSPHCGTFGKAGRPIQEERDYLLSHSVYHACCAAPPSSCVVAVLGAAHVDGFVRHFGSFAKRGCVANCCGVEAEVRALHEVSRAPVYAVLGVLLLASCASWAGRWALVRHLRRRHGAVWARRFNVASFGAGAGLGCFGLYRARRQYDAVRWLQLCRLKQMSE